jgi:IS6 family transposase
MADWSTSCCQTDETHALPIVLGKALTTMRHWPPSSITTDQLSSYPKAISRLQREGKLTTDTKHRTCKYLNDIIEAAHGALKRVIRPTKGFQTMKTASATIKGFEVMRMIRRGHCLTCMPHVKEEIRFVNKLFGIFKIAA